MEPLVVATKTSMGPHRQESVKTQNLLPLIQMPMPFFLGWILGEFFFADLQIVLTLPETNRAPKNDGFQ